MKKILVFIAILGVFIPRGLAQTQLLDRVVAVVNDEVITQSEIDYLLRPVYIEYKEKLMGQELVQSMNEARRKLLSQLIEDRLVFQKAEEEGVTVTEKEISESMQQFRDQFPDEVAMEEAMKLEGVTTTKLEERLRRQAMIRELHSRQVRSFVVVSPLEVEAFYKENQDKFRSDEKIRIRSITIKKSDEARRKGLKDEFAENKMERLLAQIEQGSDFEELAKMHSEDVRAKDGGKSEWITRGSMIPIIDDVIFKLSAKELSKIVETAMGYHLFFLEEKQEGTMQTFEEAKESIRSHLYAVKSQDRFNEWMESLKKEAYISIR